MVGWGMALIFSQNPTHKNFLVEKMIRKQWVTVHYTGLKIRWG